MKIWSNLQNIFTVSKRNNLKWNYARFIWKNEKLRNFFSGAYLYHQRKTCYKGHIAFVVLISYDSIHANKKHSIPFNEDRSHHTLLHSLYFMLCHADINFDLIFSTSSVPVASIFKFQRKSHRCLVRLSVLLLQKPKYKHSASPTQALKPNMARNSNKLTEPSTTRHWEAIPCPMNK